MRNPFTFVDVQPSLTHDGCDEMLVVRPD